jgi:hypothetical protein
MKYPTFLIVLSAVLYSVQNAQALEFDRRAREMGMEGLAWDGTFTVYATDEQTAKEALSRIQEAYTKILEQLNQRQLRKRCLVFVWRDRYKFILQASQFVGFSNISHMGAFVVENFWKGYHALFTFKSDELYDNVLPHELAHLVLPIFLNPTKRVVIPLWLNEGYAQFQEKDSFTKAVGTVSRAAKEKRLFQLDVLASFKKYPGAYEQTRVFYDQSELLVKMLIGAQEERGNFFNFVYAMSCKNESLASALKTSYPQWPTLEALQEEFRSYVDRLSRQVPAECYRSAYLKLRSAKKMQHDGEKEQALRNYALALSEFVLLSESFPGFEPGAIGKLKDKCRSGMADVSGMEKSVSIEIGDYEKKLLAALGEPDEVGPASLRYPGLEIGVDEDGMVTSVEMKPPCDRMINGVRIGDTLSRVEMLHGVKSRDSKEAMSKLLVNGLKLLSLEKLEPGTYPLESEGKFLGEVVKLEGDETVHFIGPLGEGRAVEKITFKDDAVQSFELREPDSAREPGKKTSASKEARRSEDMPDFDIGDHESKFNSLLGEPLDRSIKLMHERRFGGGARRKSTITDRLQMFQLVYPGLSVITAQDRAVCITATGPYKGRVGGIAIGDTGETVERLFGRSDTGWRLGYLYKKFGDKVRYQFSMKDGRVCEIKAYRSRYKGGKLRF